MAETTEKTKAGRQKQVVGEVVSNRMNKTIVVKVTRTKAHGFYGRVVSHDKKFYAHDEQNTAHIGDVVRLEETRPMLRWPPRFSPTWIRLQLPAKNRGCLRESDYGCDDENDA